MYKRKLKANFLSKTSLYHQILYFSIHKKIPNMHDKCAEKAFKYVILGGGVAAVSNLFIDH